MIKKINILKSFSFPGGQKFNTIFYRLLTNLLLIQTSYIILTLTNQFGRSTVTLLKILLLTTLALKREDKL